MARLTRLPPAARRWALWSLLGALLAGAVALNWATSPPEVPRFAALRNQWRPSEAWLYDRNGHLLDERRVDYDVRRLAWTPLERIAPALRDDVVAAEDRRAA